MVLTMYFILEFYRTQSKSSNKQNYSINNKLYKQFDSTYLLTADSIVTGCRAMLDSV
jgi:hypothetical protein